MRRGIGGGDFEPVEERRDTELTLGPVMLLSIFLGLVLLCGLFFGFGYATGRRGEAQKPAVNAPPAGVPLQVAVANSATKPPATSQNPCQPQQADVTSLQPGGNVLGAPVVSPQNGGWTPVGSAALTQPQVQVRPAMTPPANGSQPATSPAANYAGPSGMSQNAGLMVQVAAVSHAEDANVLVNALRKRGYAATARREPADGLIHVQIGPFANRNDANAMGQRLLGDGYNAIVLP
jgi:DedD protein